MPIYLTFYHGRNVFRSKEFAPWVLNFKTVEFDGFECGHYFPTLKMSMEDFAENKHKVKDYIWSNLVRVRGEPTVLEHILGFRAFDNKLEGEIEKAKIEFETDPLPPVL